MPKTIEIGGRLVGDGCPAFIIAEIGLNHNGQLHIAKALIDAAKSAEVDAVKFQKRSLKSLYKKEYLENPNLGEQSIRYLVPILQEFELPDEVFHEIIEYCREQEILFLCSPWDRDSVDFLENEGLVAYKVASADLPNFHLLEHIAAMKKPIILSTGMSILAEIDRTVAFLNTLAAKFALLHCNSTYPAPFHNINLNFMTTLRERYQVVVGYSGHEKGIAVSEAAATMGAAIIERHFTLDRTMRGPDHAASLEVAGLKKLVRDIRNIETALGSSYKWVSRGEVVNREVLGKSLVTAKDIKSGEIIERSAVTVRSPAKGISPQRLYDLVDRRSIRDIPAGTYFSEDDFGAEYLADRKVRTQTKWGFPVRFSDIDSLYHDDIHFYEFHLSDGDLEGDLKLNKYDSCVALHVPEYWKDDVIDLCSNNPRVREMSIEVVARSLKIARGLHKHFPKMKGKPIPVIVHPGGMSLDMRIGDSRQLYKNLRAAIQALDLDGVNLLLENMPPLPWYFGGQWCHNVFLDADEIVEFVQDLGLEICFDLSHAVLTSNWAGIRFDEYTNKLLRVAGHIHISDGAGLDGEGLQIGEGEIDFKQILLLCIQKNLPILLEIWLGHKFKGEGFWIALKSLEDIVLGQ